MIGRIIHHFLDIPPQSRRLSAGLLLTICFWIIVFASCWPERLWSQSSGSNSALQDVGPLLEHAMLLSGTTGPPELPDKVAHAVASSLNDMAGAVEDPHNRIEFKVSGSVPTELPWLSLGGGLSADGFAILDAWRSGKLNKPENMPASATGEMAFIVKDPKRSGQTVGKITIRSNPVDRTLGMTIETGEVKALPNGEKIQGSVSLEMKYGDNYHYFNAIGLTPKTLPGGGPALQLTEMFTGHKPPPPEGSSSPSPKVMDAVASELRSTILPTLAQDQEKFASITMAKSVSVIIPEEEVVRIGKMILTDSEHNPLAPFERVAPEVKLTYSESNRYGRGEDGAVSGSPVPFSETSIELSRGNGIGEGKLSLTLARTSDPEKRDISETQRRLAAAIRSGTPAMKAAADLLGPLVRTENIERAFEKIVSPPRGNEAGVRMEWDAAMLARVLATRTTSEDLQTFASLDQNLQRAASETAREQVLQEFRDSQNQRLLALRSTQPVDNLIAVSLAATLARAEQYRERWNQLPDELRFPGSLGRIYGYILEPERNNLLLLGTAAGREAERIDLNDLIVSLQTVWRDHQFPLCSIDPNPDDFAQPHKSRVAGVPADSGFALTMLNADYDMKRINTGLDPSLPDGFHTFASLWQGEPDHRERMVRFWFYPIQPKLGAIQISPDGRSAIFSAGVQLLSEQMLRARDGLIGSGSAFLPAQRAADSFTHDFSVVAKDHSWLARLQGLFDLVLLAKILEQENVSLPLLNQIADLPIQRVDVPQTYPALVNRSADMVGGVKANVGVSRRILVQADDVGFSVARQKAEMAAATASLATSLPGVQLQVADVRQQSQAAEDLQLELAYTSLVRGDFDLALSHLKHVLYADPFNASAYSVKSLISFQRRDCAAARANAARARDLATENGPKLLASFILFECSMLAGKTDEARTGLESALQLEPNDARMHELRGLLLMQTNDIGGARSEFRESLRLDPTYALAYATLGVLEAGQGWFARGKRLVETAYKLAPDLGSVKWALAYLKALNGMAYGNEEEAFRSAVSLAREVIGSASSDPFLVEQARLIPFMIDLKRKDIAAARGDISDAERTGPLSLFFYLRASQLANGFDARDLAIQLLHRAASLAPDSPLVAAARKDLEQ